MAPFRGRAAELGVLEGLIESAVAGRGGLALVEGPAGIGKTSLLDEAAGMARARRLVVAAGVGDELDQVTPWGLLLGALSSTDPALLTRRELVSDDPLVDRRLEVAERIRSSLEAAASRGPLLIVLDDIQWADPATLVALGAIPGQLFSYPVVWLLARRPVPTSVQLHALLARLDRQGAVSIRLGPLAPAEVDALAADLLGAPMDRTSERMVAGAEGNPLYIVEVLRSADDQPAGGTGGSGARSHQVPGSLASAVAAHVRSLSASAADLIKVASVLGPTFSAEELSSMTARPAGRLLAPTEEALAAGVLIEADNGLAFRHDLFRQAVYDDLPISIRPALHRDAASALLAAGAPAVRVATHLAIGAQPGDEEAIDILTRAVDELFGTSPSAAADVALRLLDLIPREDARRGPLVGRAVQLLGWTSRLEEAREVGDEYLARRDLPAEVEAGIEAGIRRAWIQRTVVPYPAPVPSRLLTDPAIPARVRANLIEFEQLGAMWHRPAEEVGSALREVAELIADSGDDTDHATLLAVRVALAHEHGDLVTALDLAQAATDRVAKRPASRALGTFQVVLAPCLAAVGRSGEALETLVEALRRASAAGDVDVVAHCHSTTAAVLLDLGRLDDGRAEAEGALETAEDLRTVHYGEVALATVVETSIRQGDLAHATAALDEHLLNAPTDTPTGDRCWALSLCADARARPGEALDALAPVMGRLRRDRLIFTALRPSRLPQIVHLALRAGDSEQADVAVCAADELAHRNPGLAVTAAVAAHARGILDGDVDTLGAAADLLARGEQPLVTALANEDLGHALHLAGRKDEAIAACERAHSIFLSANATRDLARVRSALHALGVRKRQASIARHDRGWASLTKAELAVVRIVAQGHTNRETASQLFLSPETINTHLRHAFGKLGVRSRVELARAVIEHDGPAPAL